MKKKSLKISPRYIVDSSGNKIEVILDVSTFEEILETLEDFYFGLQAEKTLTEGEFVDFSVVNKKSKKCSTP